MTTIGTPSMCINVPASIHPTKGTALRLDDATRTAITLHPVPNRGLRSTAAHKSGNESWLLPMYYCQHRSDVRL
jgi:hypothetical protein